MESWLFVPVMRGYWRQHQLWDGSYTLADFLDIMEIIAVEDENNRRQQAQQEMEMRLATGGQS